MPILNEDLHKLKCGDYITKCTKKRFCTMLKVSLNNSDNGHQKGLSVLRSRHTETGEWDMPGIVYMRHIGGDMGKYGLVIQFCPWCGEDLIKLLS